MSERGKNYIPACLICEHVIILILGFVGLLDTPRAQQVMLPCESCGPEQIESAGLSIDAWPSHLLWKRGGETNKCISLLQCAPLQCSG